MKASASAALGCYRASAVHLGQADRPLSKDQSAARRNRTFASSSAVTVVTFFKFA